MPRLTDQQTQTVQNKRPACMSGHW